MGDERADEKGVDEEDDVEEDEDEVEDEVEENYDDDSNGSAAGIRRQQKAAKKEIDRESAVNAYKITECLESYYKDMQMLVEDEISICEHFNLSSQEMSMRKCARVMAQLRAEMMKASAEIVTAIVELKPKSNSSKRRSLLAAFAAADKSDAIRRSVFARLTALEKNADDDEDDDVEDDDEQESRTADVDETCTNYGHEQTASANEMNYHESDSDSDSDSDEYGSLTY